MSGERRTPTVVAVTERASSGTNSLNRAVWSLWSDLDGGVSPNCVAHAPNGQGLNVGTTMMNNTNPAIGATSPQMTSGPGG